MQAVRVDVYWLTATGSERRGVEELETLLAGEGAGEGGWVWVDVPQWSAAAEQVLRDVFGFHPRAVNACRERIHVPTLHAYVDHLFLTLHAPELGVPGHVHLLELDQFIGGRYLVTVHGPINPVLPPEAALTETTAARRRIDQHRFAPRTPMELSYAITTAMVRRLQQVIDTIAVKVAGLEQRVMSSNLRSPEMLLEEMFLVRHELLTVRTMAAQGAEVVARAAVLARFLPADQQAMIGDLAEQYNRVLHMVDGEKEFLLGVIDLYQTRTTTKMTIAMERLAVLAAVTLPITAIASIVGMNVIVNSRTQLPELLLVLAVMATISGLLLRWTRHQGWW